MEKKALQLASVASMIDQFNIPNIKVLQSLGYSVDVVADFTNPGTITTERADNLRKLLEDAGVCVYDIEIPRSLNPKLIINAYKKVKNLINIEHYNLIHCHSPIGGAICRLAARGERSKGARIIYTAHGFHFYSGAPAKNWLVFYPIEKWLSRYTDVLITINKEDYIRAGRNFKAKEVLYIPGIGVDTESFSPNTNLREKIRKELMLKEKDIMLLSVGELNENKNHSSVIKAINGMNLTYVIVGKGELRKELESLAAENNVNLKLMGFRSDVDGFYAAADVYVLPSIREGLNVSLMEAMACSLPVACSNIRGNVDLIDDKLGGFFFDPTSTDDIRRSLMSLIENKDRASLGEYNSQKIKNFSKSKVLRIMTEVYSDKEG